MVCENMTAKVVWAYICATVCNKLVYGISQSIALDRDRVNQDRCCSGGKVLLTSLSCYTQHSPVALLICEADEGAY